MASKPYDFAVDIDMLEKEISASEQNRMPDALKGNIGANYDASAKAEGSSHMSTDQTHGELGSDGEFNTLDEPIWTTANRDLKVIRGKFRQVLLPSSENQQSNRDWDLWGPIFICVVLSLLFRSGSTQGLEFTTVFTLAFFGCCVVTLNIKLLGGRISFPQTLCVIGYCLLPTVFSAAVCRTLSMMLANGSKLAMALRFFTAGVGFLWSIYASMAFLSGAQMEARRKSLGLFPIVLFYLIVSWLVVAYT